MNSIFQALNSGYSPEEIVGFLSKAIPSIAPMVNKAKKSGYQTQQILGFLSKSFGREDIKGLSENERHVANKRADAERTKFGLKAVASAVATPLVANAAKGALSRALPTSLQGLVGSQVAASPQPVANNIQTPSPSNPQVASALEPTSQIDQTQTPSPTPSNSALSPSQPPISGGTNLPQNVDNQQLPENNLEPLTEQDHAYKALMERKKESERLFELAKEKRPGKEASTPFMRMARELMKKGQIKSAEEFDEFRKYWRATEDKKRGSPLVEFETFRSKRPPTSNEDVSVNLPQEPTSQVRDIQSEKVTSQTSLSEEKGGTLRPKMDPDKAYPRDFFKGKKKETIDQFANERLMEAFSEIEKGIANGEDYGVFHGDEWQAVGHKDVNEGSPIAPNEPKRHIGPGKKLIQVIEEHVPTRGLYHYYYDTAEKRKRMPFNKFSRGYEKAVEEMIVKKTNPELYKQQQEKEDQFLQSLKRNETPSVDLFDEMEQEIKDILFNQQDEEFEEYLEKMIKRLR